MSLLSRYGLLLRGTGAGPALAASLVGRLALGTTGLALLLLVEESTGSYASAGAVAAAYAVSFAAFAPARARSADRRGPRGVLLLCSLAHPVVLLALVLLAAADTGTAVLVVMAVLAGATVPPLGGVMRALWAGLAERDARIDLTTAYSLESVVVELCFVLGPLLAAGLAALVNPSAALLTSGALALTGALWLSTTAAVKAVQPHDEPATSRFGPLVSPAVRALLVVTFALGAGFGTLEVALPAFAEETGSRPSTGGLLLAVWSLGSMVGGLVYGALQPRTPQRRQLPVLVGALAVTSALPLLADRPVLMALLLVPYGMCIAPTFACTSVLLGEAAPRGTVTEAFAWNTSMIFGGAALGNAAAGVLVEAGSSTSALLLLAGTGLVAVGLSVFGLIRIANTRPALP